MANINAIILAKRKDKELKIKFVIDLQKRLLKYTNRSNFERFDIIQLPNPMSKLQALEYVMGQITDNDCLNLVNEKLSRYQKKQKTNEYKISLTKPKTIDITPEQLLEAIQ